MREEPRVLNLVANAIEQTDAYLLPGSLREVACVAAPIARQLGVDLEAMAADRMVKGSLKRGPLDLFADPRDFRRETLEELVDAMNYLAMAIVQREIMG